MEQYLKPLNCSKRIVEDLIPFSVIQRLYRNCILLFANMTTFFQEWLLTNIYSVSTTWNMKFAFYHILSIALFFKMAAIALWAKKGTWKTLLKAQRTQGLSVVAKVWLITHVRTSNTNLDLNLSSKSCPSFGFKICTKIQPQNFSSAKSQQQEFVC